MTRQRWIVLAASGALALAVAVKSEGCTEPVLQPTPEAVVEARIEKAVAEGLARARREIAAAHEAEADSLLALAREAREGRASGVTVVLRDVREGRGERTREALSQGDVVLRQRAVDLFNESASGATR